MKHCWLWSYEYSFITRLFDNMNSTKIKERDLWPTFELVSRVYIYIHKYYVTQIKIGAMLYSAVCISDKAGMCGKRVKQVTSQPYLLLIGKEGTDYYGYALRSSNSKQKFLFKYVFV